MMRRILARTAWIAGAGLVGFLLAVLATRPQSRDGVARSDAQEASLSSPSEEGSIQTRDESENGAEVTSEIIPTASRGPSDTPADPGMDHEEYLRYLVGLDGGELARSDPERLRLVKEQLDSIPEASQVTELLTRIRGWHERMRREPAFSEWAAWRVQASGGAELEERRQLVLAACGVDDPILRTGLCALLREADPDLALTAGEVLAVSPAIVDLPETERDKLWRGMVAHYEQQLAPGYVRDRVGLFRRAYGPSVPFSPQSTGERTHEWPFYTDFVPQRDDFTKHWQVWSNSEVLESYDELARKAPWLADPLRSHLPEALRHRYREKIRQSAVPIALRQSTLTDGHATWAVRNLPDQYGGQTRVELLEGARAVWLSVPHIVEAIEQELNAARRSTPNR